MWPFTHRQAALPRAGARTNARQHHQQHRRLEALHVVAAAMTPGMQAIRIKLVVPRHDRSSAAPSVKVGPSLLPGRFVINYPLSLLIDEPDDVVLGTLSHEYQHILGRDGKVRQRLGDLVRQVGLLSVCGGFGAAVPTIMFLVLPSLPATVASIVVLAAGCWLLLRWITRVVAAPEQPKDLARNRQAELRCDLAAVRTVGREPVMAMLRHGGLLDGQSHLPLAERTHPPIELRIAAVRAYDVHRDPAEVAAEILKHGRAQPDFTHHGRRSASTPGQGRSPRRLGSPGAPEGSRARPADTSQPNRHNPPSAH